MTTKSRLALLSSLATTPIFAAPFLAIGDNAELFLTARTEVRYEDNVFLADTNEASDEVFEFTPGLELVFGKDSLTRGTLTAYERFIAYSDRTALNEELANVFFNSSYEGAKLNLNTDASFREMFQNNRDSVLANTLVRFDTYAAGLNGELTVTEKSKVGAGLRYDQTDYKTAGFTDRQVYTVPVNYYFAIRPKLDLSTGVQYRKTDVKSGADSEDYYFNVGARGEFTPKLIGTFTVGYTTRESDDVVSSDENTLGLDAGLTYLYSEKTQFTLNLGNDFGTASTGGGQEIASINLGVRSQFAVDWSGRFNVGYQKIDFLGIDREDDYATALLGTTYTINQYLDIDAYYSYSDNSNDTGVSEFTANTFSISANFRY